jgi:hypothetical protein
MLRGSGVWRIEAELDAWIIPWSSVFGEVELQFCEIGGYFLAVRTHGDV